MAAEPDEGQSETMACDIGKSNQLAVVVDDGEEGNEQCVQYATVSLHRGGGAARRNDRGDGNIQRRRAAGRCRALCGRRTGRALAQSTSIHERIVLEGLNLDEAVVWLGEESVETAAMRPAM